MIRYGRHLGREFALGIQDNLQGLWQLVRHPWLTLIALLKAVAHPVQTLRNLLHFAWRSPVRFMTNLGLSFLEGHYLTVGWQKFVQGGELGATALIAEANNTTMAASEAVLQAGGTWQGLTQMFTGMAKAPTRYCSATQQCTLPGATSALPSTAATTTSAVLEYEGKKKKRF